MKKTKLEKQLEEQLKKHWYCKSAFFKDEITLIVKILNRSKAMKEILIIRIFNEKDNKTQFITDNIIFNTYCEHISSTKGQCNSEIYRIVKKFVETNLIKLKDYEKTKEYKELFNEKEIQKLY